MVKSFLESKNKNSSKYLQKSIQLKFWLDWRHGCNLSDFDLSVPGMGTVNEQVRAKLGLHEFKKDYQKD